MKLQKFIGVSEKTVKVAAVAAISALLGLPAVAKNSNNSVNVGDIVSKRTQTEISSNTLLAGGPPGATKPANIVQIASRNQSFKTLTKALQAAGLTDTLSKSGPFTVFAPTDEAFAALEKQSPGTVDKLLKPENKATLVKILTYHVVSGSVM